MKGYFDADGHLSFERKPRGSRVRFKGVYHYYPRIVLTSISRDLIFTDIERILETVGLHYNACGRAPSRKGKNKVYIVAITGEAQLGFWMEKVGSSNPIHLSRYHVWKKFGFCPPKTAMEQRLAMFSGELDPDIFYKGGERTRG